MATRPAALGASSSLDFIQACDDGRLRMLAASTHIGDDVAQLAGIGIKVYASVHQRALMRWTASRIWHVSAT
jgi:hypothetical protein